MKAVTNISVEIKSLQKKSDKAYVIYKIWFIFTLLT
jgi:hypothetical protein